MISLKHALLAVAVALLAPATARPDAADAAADAPATDRRITLRVTDPDGRPIPGAKVRFRLLESSDFFDPGDSRFLEAERHEGGIFISPPLGEGLVMNQVTAEGYGDPRVSAPEEPGQPYTYILYPLTLREVVVVDAETGEPLDEYRVAIRNYFRAHWNFGDIDSGAVRRSRQGPLQLEVGAHHRCHVVEFRRIGYRSVRLEDYSLLKEDGITTIALERDEMRNVRVVDPSGVALPGIGLYLMRPGERHTFDTTKWEWTHLGPHRAQTDDAGFFLCPTLASSPFVVVFHESGYAVESPAGFDEGDDLRLKPWREAQVALNPNLERIPTGVRAEQTATNPQDEANIRLIDNAEVLADGLLHFDKLMRGPARVREYGGEYHENTLGEFEVGPEPVTIATLQPLGGPVCGHVVLPDGVNADDVDLEGARVRLSLIDRSRDALVLPNLGAYAFTTRVTASGEYFFPHIPSGEARISVDIGPYPPSSMMHFYNGMAVGHLRIEIPPPGVAQSTDSTILPPIYAEMTSNWESLQEESK